MSGKVSAYFFCYNHSGFSSEVVSSSFFKSVLENSRMGNRFSQELHES